MALYIPGRVIRTPALESGSKPEQVPVLDAVADTIQTVGIADLTFFLGTATGTIACRTERVMLQFSNRSHLCYRTCESKINMKYNMRGC